MPEYRRARHHVGASIAFGAYGKAIGQAARSAAAQLLENSQYRRECARGLAIDDARTLLSGLRQLQKFAATLP